MSTIDSKIAKKIIKVSKNSNGDLSYEQVLSILRSNGVGSMENAPTTNGVVPPIIPKNYKLPPKTLNNWNRVPLGLMRGVGGSPMVENWDLCKHRYLLVTGVPGAGKSTLMKNVYDRIACDPQFIDAYYLSTLSDSLPKSERQVFHLIKSLDDKLMANRDDRRRTVLLLTVGNLNDNMIRPVKILVEKLFYFLSYYPKFSLAIELGYHVDALMKIDFKGPSSHHVYFRGDETYLGEELPIDPSSFPTGVAVSQRGAIGDEQTSSMIRIFDGNGTTDELVRYDRNIEDFSFARSGV